MSFFLICATIGLFAGVIAGLLGVGGGIVLVPAFVRFLNMDMRTAVGTSSVIIIFTALSAGVKHYQLGNVSVRTVLLVAVLSTVGAYLGASLTSLLPGRALRMVFAVFIFLVSIQMFVKAWQMPPEASTSNALSGQTNEPPAP